MRLVGCLMLKLAVTRTASVRSCRLIWWRWPVRLLTMAARTSTADWNTRQPVTEERTTPVRANPAMKWSRQGQPQKMDTKVMMKVVMRAECSSLFSTWPSSGTAHS